MSDERAIPISRGKLVFLVLASLAFIAVGIGMFRLDDAAIYQQRTLNNPLLYRGVAVLAVALGVLGVVFSSRKMFDKRPGLVLSAEGITDHSSGVSVGFIPWSDITGFNVVEIRSTKLIAIILVDPEKYMARRSAVQRALYKANQGLVGSPVSISTTALDIPFAELWELLEQYRAKYQVR